MTCASCANRIERKLNKLDGVTATVNYATEKASVQPPAGGRRRATCCAPSSRPATPPRRRGRPRAGPTVPRHGRRAPHRGPRRRVLVVRRPHPAGDVLAMAPGGRRTGRGLVAARTRPPRSCCGPACRSTAPPWSTPPRRLHHGHAGLARHAGGVPLVGRRARRRRPRPMSLLLRDRGGRHDLPPRRAVRRGAGQAPGRGRAARAARARRQGRRRAARRPPTARDRTRPTPTRPGRPAAPGHPLRRTPRGEGRHRRRRRVRALQPRPSLLTGESVPVEVGPGDEVVGATVNAGGRLVVRATAVGPTPSWPRSPGWSSRPSPARRRCSGWPTGSPRSSSRSCWSSRSPPWPAGC